MFKTDFGMNPDIRVIKRSYCCICGKKLKRKLVFLSYKVKGLFRIKRDVVITPVYVCKNCDYEIMYSKQKEINAIQNKCDSYILPDGKNMIRKLKINKYFDKESGFYLTN